MSFFKKMNIQEKQKVLLAIMDEIHSFCIKNNIEYYLVGGSLIGAVRHNGFIPWDDDIDIAFKRKDYDKFISSFVSQTGDVDVLTLANNKHHKWPYAKASYNKTICIENKHKKNAIGVNVDLFPLDYVGNDINESIKLKNKISKYQNIIALKYLNLSNKRSLLKNLIIIFGKLLYVIPDSIILKQIFRIVSENTYDKKTEYLCNLVGAWGDKEITSSINFDSTVLHEFEGREYLIPVGYHEYLKKLYGKYMELPPEEKRCSHHGAIAYWK